MKMSNVLLKGLISMSIFAGMIDAATNNFPDPAQQLPKPKGIQKVVLAGGCFWCTEAVFEKVAGVQSVVSGYAGGDAGTAHYEMVGSGKTKHAEAIQVTYDPEKVSYGQLLKIFFSVAHDPTTLNRQGPDWGPQYRSAVFYQSAEEKQMVEKYIAQLNAAKIYSNPIVTTLEPLTKFYDAEGYHQDYVKRNPNNPYVMVNSVPKVKKLENTFPALVKK
jgi:peptide-methionine (S)-S-oxide reductase